MSNEIKFYRTSEIPYGCFSNFSDHPLTFGDNVFKTSEHFFQAMKYMPFRNADQRKRFQEILDAETPKEAARLGRLRDVAIRSDWESVKDSVMYVALHAKFTQHKDIKEILLSTGNSILIEHTINDSYWGDGLDGSGKNMLGKLLMKLREKLLD